MKAVILYAYPPEPDGLSLQGDMLYRGMKEIGEQVAPCHWKSDLQKEWIYRYFKPDVAIGIGCWSYAPDIILHPQKFGITPVPWLVADGWVAGFHSVLSALPLVLTTSEWVKQTYKRDGVDIKNFEAVPVGVEPDIFKPIPKSDPKIKELQKMIGIEPGEKVILTVGGDVTSKGAQEIIKALALVDKEFGNWKYICKTWDSRCAYGHKKEEMELIEQLGLDKKKIIHLSGPYSREFMPYLLNMADIYAAPSRLEGFGMIQVEAQACGLPVISIDEMGPKETIIHNQTGFLAKVERAIDLESELDPLDAKAGKKTRIFFDKPKTFAYRADINELKNYLLALLIDGKKRGEMGKRAREHAVQKFHYQKIAKEIADLIKKRLLEKNPNP